MKMDATTVQNQFDIFNNIGKILASSLDIKEVFRRVMEVIGDYFAPQNWSLLLMEEETGRLKFEIVMGVDAGKLKNFYLERGEGIAGWVCLNGKPIVVEDVRKDPRFSSRVDQLLDFQTRSVVCVPLVDGKNRIVGVIELINKLTSELVTSDSGGVFTEMDMAILSSIGIFTGIAIENAFLHQKIVELAMIDSLTGVNTRHYFNETFEREVERIYRYGHTVCVLMMDVDGLKAINDQHGHLTGDKIIRTVADILKSSVRKSDIVARFGGDEFVVLMPMSDESNGRELSKRIQELIDEWNKKSLIPGVKLGLSIGIHEAGPTNAKDILSIADQKLYQDKSLKKKAEEITSEDQMRRYLRDTLPEENE
ncbi:MAG: sensor domain-containing diguanylate cyclase [Syntrophales bacterium]|nr:sensor domain-containing diguanylate cyclase [Syntrophales bacterium]